MAGLGEAINQATGELPEVEQPTREMPTAELPAAGNGVADGSVLAAIRARAAELQEEHTVELPIPGYRGVLVGVYRAVNPARFNRIDRAGLTSPFTDWPVAADVLATALVGLYGRNEAGELEPLDPNHETRFDADLATKLPSIKPTANTARAVLVALCGGGERGEGNVWQHFLAYQGWLSDDAGQEVAEEAVGES
jgi:hypothetical protein